MHRHCILSSEESCVFCGLLWYVYLLQPGLQPSVSQAVADTHMPQQTTELSSQLTIRCLWVYISGLYYATATI